MLMTSVPQKICVISKLKVIQLNLLCTLIVILSRLTSCYYRAGVAKSLSGGKNMHTKTFSCALSTFLKNAILNCIKKSTTLDKQVQFYHNRHSIGYGLKQ